MQDKKNKSPVGQIFVRYNVTIKDHILCIVHMQLKKFGKLSLQSQT